MLTAAENRAIQELPPIYQEFLNAKFKTRLKTYHGNDLCILVKELVEDTLFASGVKDKNDSSVKQYLTKTLTEDLQHPRFSALTFEEIEIACKKGVRQEYGAFMGVNIQTIHSWIRAYLNSKDRELAIKEFYSKVSEFENGKVDKMSPVNPEGQRRVVEMMRSVIKTVPDEEVKRKEKAKSIHKSDRDIFIQNCFIEHYKIWLKDPYKPKAPKSVPGTEINMDLNERYIIFDGRPVNEVEYTQERLKEYDQINNTK